MKIHRVLGDMISANMHDYERIMRTVGLTLLFALPFVGQAPAFAAEPADSDAAKRLCITEAKKGTEFRNCGYDWSLGGWLVTWIHEGERIDTVLFCRGQEGLSYTIGTGKDYAIIACGPTTERQMKSRGLGFTLAYQGFSDFIGFNLNCACTVLTADRLFFDPEKKVISFNLQTDATTIKVEENDFQLPPVVSRQKDGRSEIDIPVFTVQFNQHWQITGFSAEKPASPMKNDSAEQK